MNKKISLWIILSLLVVGLLGASIAEAKTLSITYGEPWKELIGPAIKDFETETGVKVDVTMVPYGIDMIGKLSLDLAAGVASDVIMVDSFMIPAWAEAGYLYELDDYFAGWPDWDQYFTGMKNMVSFEGVHYAIMISTGARILWYSKPVFEKAGIPMPWEPKNWSDVLSTALTIKEKTPEVDAPFFIPLGTKWAEGTTMQGFYPLLLGADTPEGDRNKLRDWEARKWIGSSPAIEKALGFYRDVFITYELSPIDPHYVPDVWGEWRRMMRDGEIGIGLGGQWEWAEFWPAPPPPIDERKALIGWVPMPGSGKPDAPKITTLGGGNAIGINKAASDPDLAWKFMEILHSKVRTAEWNAAQGKVAVRKDALEVPAYAGDDYLMEITALVEKYSITDRDVYPGYTTVSFFLQEATEDVAVEGLSVATAMDKYTQKLIEEFGADMVKTIP